MRKKLSLHAVLFLALLLVLARSVFGQAPASRPGSTQSTAGGPVAAKAPESTQPAEPAKLHCQVFNQAGMGLARASVEASVLGAAGWMPLAAEQTGKAGECDLLFGGTKPTLLQLKVSAAGYQDAETLYLPRTKDVIPWLTITLKGAKTLMGRVVTEDRQGVPNATVVIETPAGQVHTETSSAGYFEFQNLMPMKAVLAVHVPGVGIGAYRVDLTAEEIKPIEIVLYAQRRVTLRVLDQKQKPLPGLMVEVLAPQATNIITDDEGKIPINGVGSGPGRVVVRLHDDYYRLDEPAVALEIGDGEEPVDLEITATQGGLVEGQVVEKESGEGIPAAVVWFVAGGKFGPNITCDVEGKFKFEAIPEDDYLVAAGHGTYSFAVAPASVEAGKKTELKFSLSAGASIQGVVLDAAGKPVPRAIVRAATWLPKEPAAKIESGKAQPLQIPWRAVRANTDGQFLLEYLPAGQITLEIADQNGREQTSKTVQLPDDNKVMEMNLQLSSRQP